MKNKRALELIEKLNINTIDIKILIFCFGTSKSVSELVKDVGVAHKNLLVHLKKLEKFNLIKVLDSGKGKKKEIQTITSQESLAIIYFVFGIISLYTEPEILKKNKTLRAEITRFLIENQA